MKRWLILLMLAAALPAAATNTVVETIEPTNVQQYSAVLWGAVTWTNQPGTSLCYFAWGTTDGADSLAAWSNQSFSRSRTSTGMYWISITDLTADTNYYVRAFVTNTDGLVFGPTTLTFRTLTDYPTNPVVWSQQTVMVDTDGVVVNPTNFWDANGIIPTQNYEVLEQAIASNDADIAEMRSGVIVTTKQVWVADVTSIGACLITNPDMTNDAAWAAASASWNAGGDGAYLINAGDTGVIAPSNAVALTAGMLIQCSYSNSLASTGSVVVSVGGWTNSAAIDVGTVTFYGSLQNSSNPVIRVHATNGQTSLDGFRIFQVQLGPAHIAGSSYIGGDALVKGDVVAGGGVRSGTRMTTGTNTYLYTSESLGRSGGIVSGLYTNQDGAYFLAVNKFTTNKFAADGLSEDGDKWAADGSSGSWSNGIGYFLNIQSPWPKGAAYAVVDSDSRTPAGLYRVSFSLPTNTMQATETCTMQVRFSAVTVWSTTLVAGASNSWANLLFTNAAGGQFGLYFDPDYTWTQDVLFCMRDVSAVRCETQIVARLNTSGVFRATGIGALHQGPMVDYEPYYAIAFDAGAEVGKSYARLLQNMNGGGKHITNAVFGGDASGLSNGPWWAWSSYAPSNSSATASNYTLSVSDGTYLYFCWTNDWLGPGSNWVRSALEGF